MTNDILHTTALIPASIIAEAGLAATPKTVLATPLANPVSPKSQPSTYGAISPSLATKKLSQSVMEFKNVFQANPNILSYGQFHIRDLVQTKLDELKKYQGIPENKETSQAAKSWVESAFKKFWLTSTIDPSPSVPQPSKGKLDAAYDYEKDKCFDTTKYLAKKYFAAKGIKSVPADLKKLESGAIGSFKLTTRKELDFVDYGNLKALKATVEKIQKSLDAGYPVLCGAVSGRKSERRYNEGLLKPNHWLLIFGYDDNKFVFWDSDKTESNIDGTNWGIGFGVLIYTGKTFSTGLNDSDLEDVDGSIHRAEPKKRHRYQIFNVQIPPI